MDLFEKCRNFTRHEEVRQAGIYPYFVPIEESEGTEVEIDGRRLLMFGSNNYLGVTHDPRVLKAAARALERYGAGCTGSRFLNGTLALHEELEGRLAGFLGKEATLVFTTGFQTNLGAISALVERQDIVYTDRENHASILDGCRLSFGEIRKFKHNDMVDLEAQLRRHRDRRRGGQLIVVDGVYSMLGDLADLPEIVRLAKEYEARILVDEAHAVGVLGRRGRGTAEHFGMDEEVELILGTFSKSFGSIGGFIAGEKSVIDFIKHHARSLIFSAALPASSVAGVLAALKIIEEEPERREQLRENALFVRKSLREMGFETAMGETPIVPIMVGEQTATFLFWKELFDAGAFTNAITSPAVPAGQDLIRTSVMATHTREQLGRFLDLVGRIARKLKLVA